MMKTAELLYFSPTGGTRKTGELLAEGLAEQVKLHDMGALMRSGTIPEFSDTELVIVAAPVYGGRLPWAAAEYLKNVRGCGTKAVTLAVYGVRAYEDALLELNDILTENGFQIIASGAFAAQHSVVPEVGAGRPDEADAEDLRMFARKILEKADAGGKVNVPGNRPYKDGMKAAATPVSLPSCTKCGSCEAVCPTGAIKITEEGVVTELSRCLLCLACKAACPAGARVLPPPMQAAMNEKLGALIGVRRENEMYL